MLRRFKRRKKKLKHIVIAIDGPAGAGKSTVAQIVAQRLQYTYIDTGAMYRAVAWRALQQKQGEITTEDILSALQGIVIDLQYREGKTYVSVNGADVTEAIRTPAVTAKVSQVAKIGEVREKMVALQRQMAARGAVVMDGRDICTHVLPEADVKVFLTASIAERAKRRWKEMQAKGYDIPLEKLEADIAARDKADSEREISPLVRAKDAVLVDTTDLSIEEAVEVILKLGR